MRSRRLIITAVVIASSLVPLLYPSSSSAESSPDLLRQRIGVDAHVLWDENPTSQLQPLVEAGVTHVRADFDWHDLEPERGGFDWSDSDRLMRASSVTGVDILAVVDYSAPWASSGPNGDVHYPPSSNADFATFAEAIASRYGPHGSFWSGHPDLSPRPLTSMEIWNEPFGYWSWKPGPDPAAYARLVRSAAAAIRSVEPSMTIVASGDLLAYTTTDQRPWLTPLLDTDPGLASVVDRWSIHPYPDPLSQSPSSGGAASAYGTVGRVEQVANILKARGITSKLWVTEVGWCVSSVCGVSDAQQAQYIDDVLTMATTSWTNIVDRVFLYTWDRRDASLGQREGNYGLRYDNGSDTPAWSHVKQRLANVGPTDTPRPSLPASLNMDVVSIAMSANGLGAYGTSSAGEVAAAGNAQTYGSMAGQRLNRPIVGISASANGYWLVATDGGIFSFGDANFFGSTGSMKLNQPIVGMTSTPSHHGYWLVAADGGIFAYGDAGFFGSTGSMKLNKPIVGMTPTPTGNGYWLVASDGGIFAFGDARFFGSTGSMKLNQPITAMTASANGYWLVARDGGIFAFGDATFFGSLGGNANADRTIGMTSTATARGYYLFGEHGAITPFGDAS